MAWSEGGGIDWPFLWCVLRSVAIEPTAPLCARIGCIISARALFCFSPVTVVRRDMMTVCLGHLWMAPAWRHLKTTPLTQSIRTLRAPHLSFSSLFVPLFGSSDCLFFDDCDGRTRVTHMMTFTLFPVSLKPLEDINITQLTLTEHACRPLPFPPLSYFGTDAGLCWPFRHATRVIVTGARLVVPP